MEKLRERAAALLADGTVSLVIGFEEGTKRPRPFFCRTSDQASKLIFDSRCFHNLAVYVTKKELVGKEPFAVTAPIATLRSILQLYVENQLKEEQMLILTADPAGELFELRSFDEISAYVANFELKRGEREEEILHKIEGMTREERWQFWLNEMSQCFKCYACRSACPLCYCTKCVVEVNRPQWIHPWPAPLANMEWHINRAMHMVGRCTACGACGEACPVGIPIDLITRKMMEDLAPEFGYIPGLPARQGNALSSWRLDDREQFIR
ncbi:MAG: 4Fe-4S dicluster domain-containing protein [Marinilabiliales bacterium]|nr:4Fe-4S dicluster domain-containing protein [Marinilabiliales bacterium]